VPSPTAPSPSQHLSAVGLEFPVLATSRFGPMPTVPSVWFIRQLRSHLIVFGNGSTSIVVPRTPARVRTPTIFMRDSAVMEGARWGEDTRFAVRKVSRLSVREASLTASARLAAPPSFAVLTPTPLATTRMPSAPAPVVAG